MNDRVVIALSSIAESPEWECTPDPFVKNPVVLPCGSYDA